MGLGEVPDRFMLGRGMAGKTGGENGKEDPTHTLKTLALPIAGESAQGWGGGGNDQGLVLSPPSSQVPSHPTCLLGWRKDGL